MIDVINETPDMTPDMDFGNEPDSTDIVMQIDDVLKQLEGAVSNLLWDWWHTGNFGVEEQLSAVNMKFPMIQNLVNRLKQLLLNIDFGASENGNILGKLD